MNSTTTVIATNGGVITTLTVVHHEFRNYCWTALAVLVFALFAWLLRKIFWQPDSN